MAYERSIAILRSVQRLRNRLETVELCLDALSWEDRRVLEHFYIEPECGNFMQLCGELGVEKSGVYRRKTRALQRISQLFEENGVGIWRDDF